MKIQFTFLGGARNGQQEAFDQPFIQIGRHPQCDLRFDADRDLDVSSRHATVTRKGELYTLRDLGSTNGTFVNGKRLTADHVLAHGDRIQFGKQGPTLGVQIQREPRSRPGSVAEARPQLPTATAPDEGTPPARSPVRRTPSGTTTTRIKAEVARQTASLRRTTFILLGLLVVLAGAYLWQSVAASRRIEAERAALLRRVDSLSSAYANVQVNVASLQGALDSARAEAVALRNRIGRGGSTEELNALRAQLSAAEQRQQNITAAATLNATAVNQANADAVAVVLVEFSDGSRRTGSGFAVRTGPQSSRLVTNRHVVEGPNGALPSRMGVVFNGSNQNFRASQVHGRVRVQPDQARPEVLVRRHPDPAVDLALLDVRVNGGVPVVRGLATAAPEAGDPVAIIGYPLGLDMDMGGDWQEQGVSTSLNLGALTKVLPERLVLDGYGAAGMSGSPIFNRQGEVIGVVFGGQRDSGGRIVLGVPVRFVRELVARNE